VELEGCPDVPTQIFAVSCGTQNCHGSAGKPPLGFTDLGNSVNDITERLIDLRGTPGEECASYKVLNSKNPEQSLLFLKLDPNPPCGSHMPWGYNELSDNDRDCIRRWGMAVLAGHTVDGPCYKEP
jgi:mono/diheme cytochrome c family protein